MHMAEPIRGIPVTVLTPVTAAPLTQNQLDHIGDSVRQTIAPKSDHWIHLDEPDLVINAIRDMIVTLSVPAEAGAAMAFVNEAALREDAPLLAVPRSAR
jgi:hypothetical protein